MARIDPNRRVEQSIGNVVRFVLHEELGEACLNARIAPVGAQPGNHLRAAASVPVQRQPERPRVLVERIEVQDALQLIPRDALPIVTA